MSSLHPVKSSLSLKDASAIVDAAIQIRNENSLLPLAVAVLDSVARFHLGNGASLHDIHVAADFWEKGIKQSYGAMANYLYKLNRLDHNIAAFTTDKTVAKSREINALLRATHTLSADRSN